MNYRKFFANYCRQWWQEKPGVYRACGYTLSLDDDAKHGKAWNLYKFDRAAPDAWRCVAHNIPPSVIPDDLAGRTMTARYLRHAEQQKDASQ